MCHDPRIICRVSEERLGAFLFAVQVYAPELKWLANIMRRSRVAVYTLDQFSRYRRFLDHFAFKEFLFKVPCRKCLGCLQDKRNEWAARCLLEAKRYKHNCFVTLTYRDEDVPPELVRKHYQDFMKRLRERFRQAGIASPRQFYRGEYGEKYGRPHFHTILFNCDFPDKTILWWQKGSRKFDYPVNGAVPYYTSKFLEETWSHGFVTIAPVCEASIKYVANYLDKGNSANGRFAPFHGYSNRPGIARLWYDDRIADLDFEELMHITSMRLPSTSIGYFRRLLKEQYPDIYDILQLQRVAIACARPCHWQTLGISEVEYLQRLEDSLRERIKKFGHKKVNFAA